LHFGKGAPSDIAKLVGVGGVAPALKGDLSGQRAHLGGHAGGQIRNTASLQRTGHRSGQAKPFERFSLFQFGIGGDDYSTSGHECT